MIIIDNVTKKFGDRILFEDVACSFAPGNRYGLTGPNGAGKSTLLKIAIGASDATSGNVVLPKKFGFLKQDITEFENIKVIDVVMMGNNKLWQTLLKRDALYDKEMTDAVGMRLAELEEIVEAEGGYTADSDAEILLHGIGLSSDEFTKEMKEIPLDHQFRVLLCQALFGKPEALLLDEPTNHLDMQSINWLENFLTNYDGALVVISHDRHFLNSVCTHIADIDYDTIIVYPGNYDDMIVAKSQVRARIEMDNKAKSKKVSQLKEFVAKFSKGTRASQVQSRIKEINRLAPQDLKRSNIQRPFICFEESDKRAGTIPFKLNKLSKSFDDTQVIKKFSLEINRGEKIGVIGNNGAGKTTLVRLIAGNLPPDAGHVILGNQVEIGYFPQNHSDIVDKSSDETMLDWLRSRVPPVYEQEIRGALGKLLFSGDDAFKPISTLSGGETARLILAQLMLNKFNTLVLDEPNNHLDIESVSALSQSIENFHGTVVIVSHDRDLIGSVASKIIAFEESGIQIFAGSLEEYLSNKESVK